MQMSGPAMATLVLARLTHVASLGAHGILLGTGLREPRPDVSLLLPPGATLLLYTDGLIEEPGASLDDGLDRLSRHAAALSHQSLDTFTDKLLARARPAANEDDIALLALRTQGRGK